MPSVTARLALPSVPCAHPEADGTTTDPTPTQYECDGSTEATAEASARAMMGWLSSVHQRFGRRPIWLTEFNCGDGAAPQVIAPDCT